MKIALLLITIITFLTPAQINWFTVGNGASGQILDIASDTSGIYSDNSFYISGNFSSVSTLGTANNLIRFVDSSVVITSIKNTDEIYNSTEFILYQNFPNPFNPSTKIRFTIPDVKTGLALSVLKIYDVLGNEVATLVNEYKSAGVYEVNFNPASGIRYQASGIGLASGVYFYRLTIKSNKLSSDKITDVKKMILKK